MIWTDELVKEFCKVYSNGKYIQEYLNCNTIEKKLVVFKKLNNIGKEVA